MYLIPDPYIDRLKCIGHFQSERQGKQFYVYFVVVNHDKVVRTKGGKKKERIVAERIVHFVERSPIPKMEFLKRIENNKKSREDCHKYE